MTLRELWESCQIPTAAQMTSHDQAEKWSSESDDHDSVEGNFATFFLERCQEGVFGTCGLQQDWLRDSILSRVLRKLQSDLRYRIATEFTEPKGHPECRLLEIIDKKRHFRTRDTTCKNKFHDEHGMDV